MKSGSGSGRANALLNLMKEQDYIDKFYLYRKELSNSKCEFLIKKREDAGTNHLNDPYVFIEYSHRMDDVCEKIDDYKPNKKRKIVFDDMIANIITHKKSRP